MVVELVFEAIAERWSRRALRARVRRLQAEDILLGAVRAPEAGLGRFGTEWLSSEWRVSPGRLRCGSTTVVASSVDPVRRHGAPGDFLLPPGVDTVVLTLRGPGPTVEVAMPAESEPWFLETLAVPGGEPAPPPGL
ncbi:hypothetical protein [Demequina sp. NBRC 110056]|uniref:hypothetical protein n=1 Tax=Demequina sp. NBRC 110056 TaxID=1570345 RepID=UPI0009FFCEC1|nr:hypothetical protein [Demequina sp. NBRC 110056]